MSCEECILRNELADLRMLPFGRMSGDSGMRNFCMHLQWGRTLPLRVDTEDCE